MSCIRPIAPATDTASAVKFDSILMDVNLSHGDSGIEIAKGIRNIKMNALTRIIALIPFELEDDKAVLIDAGFNDFLIKPAAKNELREAVLKNHK